MSTMFSIEVAKLHRLRVGAIVTVMSLLITVLPAYEFLRGNHRDLSTSEMWANAVFQWSTISALLGPVVAALLASRMTEIEQIANGWLLASICGYRRGALLRTKLVVLGLISGLAVAIQAGILCIAAVIWGFGEVPFMLLMSYSCCLWAVYTALIAGYLWMAAKVESQLAVVGLGLLGGFLGVYSLLLPKVFAYLTPWGYFAAISPILGQRQHTLGQPGFLAAISITLVLTGIFIFLTRPSNQELSA